MRGGGGTISYKSLYFVHPCHNLMPFFTGMRERPTHNCITAVKWDAYAVENTAGNARRCNPGRQILLTLLTWQHQQKKLLSLFLLWSVESILEYTNYQSDCIPKSNNKQETLQTIYRGYYTVARRYEFYFRVAKQYFTNERSEWVKYCFCHEKIKFISSSRRVMFFSLYRQKDINKIIDFYPPKSNCDGSNLQYSNIRHNFEK